jgi:hypothetical protein
MTARGSHLERRARYCPDVSEERPGYAGMTVNERLYVAGLLSEFGAAIESGDRQQAIEILGSVALGEIGAAETVDAILRDPSKYGYPRAT